MDAKLGQTSGCGDIEIWAMMRRIGGRLRSLGFGLNGVVGEIPPFVV